MAWSLIRPSYTEGTSRIHGDENQISHHMWSFKFDKWTTALSRPGT